MSLLSRLLRPFHRRRPGQPPSHGSISFNSAGIEARWCTAEGASGSFQLPWAGIQSIVVFKRDLYVVDLICLAFHAGDSGPFEVHEEMEGWQALVDALPEHLPSCQSFPDWWAAVTFPAFARNETVIFSRAAA
jgi:hypothetical protein